MDKRKAVSDALVQYAKSTQGADSASLEEGIKELTKKLTKINQPPMPGWKKKLYLGVAAIGGFWVLSQYLHYEACREKYPNASGWVCLMQPR